MYTHLYYYVILYIHICNIYILNIFSEIYTCMCLYLYIHNKYTQYTHIYYVNKTFILNAINHLTALIKTMAI